MTEVHHGLEGVVAFETQIAEPDKEGSALRYRGVDIEEIVGRIPFEKVWGLLIDGKFEPGLPPAEPYTLPIHTGDVRADVQSAVAMLAPMLGMGQTYDISDEQARTDLARVAVMVLSYAAQAARGLGMSARTILWRVEMPLALPVLLSGMRVATLQAIGLAAVAALIGAGGLGAIMFQGLFSDALDLVLLGVIPIVLIALATDALFRLAIAGVGRVPR